ncbi:MAG: acyltransferase [Pseudomonadales bacterium]|nr:acyltransferase [Pseudomonadales bacterium]
MRYRKDIEGLRAIAVLSVMAYHALGEAAHNSWISGGLVGVDVFFVISGYLITSILLREKDRGSLSLQSFYIRRIKRIIPTLLTVVGVSFIVGWIYFLPKSLQSLAESGISSLFFFSNIWFFFEDSYTAQASMLKPLLHTWSLSIEEQFYLIFPLLFILPIKKQYISLVIILLLISSLTATVLYSASSPDQVFYLPHFRAWQLLLGSLAALIHQHKPLCFSAASGALFSGIGLSILLLSFYFLGAGTPGYYKLLPTLGTFLIILSSYSGNITQKILSLQPLRYIGLLSYSLYLWHMPLWAFARYRYDELSLSTHLILLALCFGLAIITYTLIEMPIRKAKPKHNKIILAGLAGVTGILISIFFITINNAGFPQRLGKAVSLFENLDGQLINPIDNKSCNNRELHELCSFNSETPYRLVLIGDSHANAISSSIFKLAKKFGYGFIQSTQNSCPHIKNSFEAGALDDTASELCHSRLAVINDFLDTKRDIVIFSARLMNSANTERQNNPAVYENKKNSLVLTLENLKRRSLGLITIGPTPELNYSLPYQVHKELRSLPAELIAQKFKQSKAYAIDAEEFSQQAAALQSAYNSITIERYRQISPQAIFCDNSVCRTHNDFQLYYYDTNHLSIYGAEALNKNIEVAVRELSR